MILIIGGFASGKRAYVRSVLGYADTEMADAVLDSRPVLYNLQDLVGQDPAASMTWLSRLADKEVVVCNEVGSGIVPVTENERAWRDAVGRLCVALAGQAGTIVSLLIALAIAMAYTVRTRA